MILTPEDRERLKAQPRCCSDHDWEEWSKATHVKPNAIDWICSDCDPEFKREMQCEGLCDWPDVEFYLMPVIDEGRTVAHTIEGRRTSIPVHRGYAEGRKIIRIVDITKAAYELEGVPGVTVAP